MNNKEKIIIFVIVAYALVLCVASFLPPDAKGGGIVSGNEAGNGEFDIPPDTKTAIARKTFSRSPSYLKCAYYDEQDLMASVKNAFPYALDAAPAAGVVPHHLLAQDMIASFFSAVSKYEYDTVLIVGPAHYAGGKTPITSYAGYNTPFSKLENDSALTHSLIISPDIRAKANDEAMEADHTATALIPYISHYLPDVRVSMLLIPNTVDPKIADALSLLVSSQAREKKVLLLCSVDFSHYLTRDETNARDEETITAIESFNYAEISRFKNDHADSPAGVLLFLKVLEQNGTKEVSFLDHSTSAEKLNRSAQSPQNDSGLTSYFVLAG